MALLKITTSWFFASTKKGCFWFWCIFVLPENMTDNKDPRINIPGQGIVEGRRAVAPKGRPFYCFQGIPYAKPPVGPLRFKEPQPPEKWDGIRQAKAEGEMCAQVEIFVTRMYDGGEDCLFLNIYTPQLETQKRPLPVMFYIHGGAFCSGSANTDIYGPDYFMEEDVVIVTVNYRLGVLGFLCLDIPEIPGNAGLKDQLMALKWVKSNIKEFGGNPDNITIFGESAGGACVEMLLLSPITKGLFQRAIAQSGCSKNKWAIVNNPVAQAFRLGELLDYRTESKTDLVDFLINCPIENLVKTSHKVALDQDFRSGVPFPFSPVIEKSFSGLEQIITKSPREIINSGEFNQVPYITGYCSAEGVLMLQTMYKQPERISGIENNFQYLVPSDMGLEWNSDKSIEISRKIKNFYFKDKVPCKTETIKEFVDLMTDYHFAKDIHLNARLLSDVSSAPVYYYRFAHVGDFNLLKNISRANNIEGAAHGDELPYLFKTLIFRRQLDPESLDGVVSQRLIKMWTNFAKQGNPTPSKDETITEIWEPLHSKRMNYLEISSELKLRNDPDQKRLEFWKDIYDNLSIGKMEVKNMIATFELNTKK